MFSDEYPDFSPIEYVCDLVVRRSGERPGIIIDLILQKGIDHHMRSMPGKSWNVLA